MNIEKYIIQKQMKMKKEKGITLVSLVITIMVLSILLGTGISVSKDSIRSSKYTAIKTELETIQTKINDIGDEYEKEGKTIGTELGAEERKILDTEEVVEQLQKKAQNDSTKLAEIKAGFRLCTPEYIKQEFGIENIERNYLINLKERTVISGEKVEYNGTNYYMLEQMKDGLYNVTYNNQVSPTGSFTVTSQKDIGKYKVKIEVTHEKYVSNWVVKYRIQGENVWQESKDLTFFVEKAGKYEIQVTCGTEVNLGTQTIQIGE